MTLLFKCLFFGEGRVLKLGVYNDWMKLGWERGRGGGVHYWRCLLSGKDLA